MNKVVHCIWTGKTQINTNNFHTDMKKRSVERKKLGRGFKSFTGLSLDFSTQTYGNLAIIFFLHASTTHMISMNKHQKLVKSMINMEYYFCPISLILHSYLNFSATTFIYLTDD